MKKQRRQGVEAEIKTVPFYNTSLLAGFAFVDAKDRDTGEKLTGVPRYTYDIGMQYNDSESFKALLKGHYIWWNPVTYVKGKYDSFVWDINVIKRIYGSESRTTELFLTAHNIFNGSQYLMDPFRNPRRWIEGGLKLNF